jgi:hypothetical protein
VTVIHAASLQAKTSTHMASSTHVGSLARTRRFSIPAGPDNGVPCHVAFDQGTGHLAPCSSQICSCHDKQLSVCGIKRHLNYYFPKGGRGSSRVTVSVQSLD